MIKKYELGKLYKYYYQDKLDTLEVCIDFKENRAILMVLWQRKPGRWNHIVAPYVDDELYLANYEEVTYGTNNRKTV